MAESRTLETTCALCHRNIEGDRSDLMGNPWEMFVCNECCRQRMLDDGGILIRFAQQPVDAAFEINDVHIRPGALHYLVESREHYWTFVTQHAQTDATHKSKLKNEWVRLPFLESGGNRATEHKTALGKRLWIMTDQNGLTVVMAPGEF